MELEFRPRPFVFAVWAARSYLIVIWAISAIYFILYLILKPIHSYNSEHASYFFMIYLVFLLFSILSMIFLGLLTLVGRNRSIICSLPFICICQTLPNGARRTIHRYDIGSIDCILIETTKHGYANISFDGPEENRQGAKSKNVTSLTVNGASPKFISTVASFFRLSLKRDLARTIVYGIPNYERLAQAIDKYMKIQS